MNESELSKEFSENVFEGFRNSFFNPEIARRKKEKLISEDFQLLAAQVIFSPNGELPLIRLNEEVSATVKVKEGYKDKIHDENYWASHDEVEKIIFEEKEYQNCGHVTMIRLRDTFILSFDFTYNRGACNKHLIVAKEFLSCAEYCFENKFFSAFIDNSYSTVELLAKCKLFLATNKKVNESKTHSVIQTEFNRYHKRSPEQFTSDEREILNKLTELRGKARYLDSEFSSAEIDFENILNTLRSMYSEIKERIIQ